MLAILLATAMAVVVSGQPTTIKPETIDTSETTIEETKTSTVETETTTTDETETTTTDETETTTTDETGTTTTDETGTTTTDETETTTTDETRTTTTDETETTTTDETGTVADNNGTGTANDNWDTLMSGAGDGESRRPDLFQTLGHEILWQPKLNDARYGFSWGKVGPLCGSGKRISKREEDDDQVVGGGGGCPFLYTLDFSKESKNCEKLVEKRGGWGFEGDELQQSCSYLSTLQPSEECEKIREKVEEAHECMAV